MPKTENLKKKNVVHHESSMRSVAKAITYRLLIVTSNTVVVYYITRRVDLTFGLIVSANLLNTVLYFAHERGWNHIHWGKHTKKHSSL